MDENKIRLEGQFVEDHLKFLAKRYAGKISLAQDTAEREFYAIGALTGRRSEVIYVDGIFVPAQLPQVGLISGPHISELHEELKPTGREVVGLIYNTGLQETPDANCMREYLEKLGKVIKSPPLIGLVTNIITGSIENLENIPPLAA